MVPTFKSLITVNSNETSEDIDIALKGVGGMEYDFECAGMCLPSKFYAFSKVGRGPPPQTCVVGINNYLNTAVMVIYYPGILFSLIALTGFIVSFYLLVTGRDI